MSVRHMLPPEKGGQLGGGNGSTLNPGWNATPALRDETPDTTWVIACVGEGLRFANTIPPIPPIPPRRPTDPAGGTLFRTLGLLYGAA